MDSEKQPEGLKGWGLGGWGNKVVGIREGTYCMEHWVWCKNNEYCYAENKLKIFFLKSSDNKNEKEGEYKQNSSEENIQKTPMKSKRRD